MMMYLNKYLHRGRKRQLDVRQGARLTRVCAKAWLQKRTRTTWLLTSR